MPPGRPAGSNDSGLRKKRGAPSAKASQNQTQGIAKAKSKKANPRRARLAARPTNRLQSVGIFFRHYVVKRLTGAVMKTPTQAPCTPALAHTSSLDTDLTRNTRAPHFTPQHWLLCYMGLY